MEWSPRGENVFHPVGVLLDCCKITWRHKKKRPHWECRWESGLNSRPNPLERNENGFVQIFIKSVPHNTKTYKCILLRLLSLSSKQNAKSTNFGESRGRSKVRVGISDPPPPGNSLPGARVRPIGRGDSVPAAPRGTTDRAFLVTPLQRSVAIGRVVFQAPNIPSSKSRFIQPGGLSKSMIGNLLPLPLARGICPFSNRTRLNTPACPTHVVVAIVVRVTWWPRGGGKKRRAVGQHTLAKPPPPSPWAH